MKISTLREEKIQFLPFNTKNKSELFLQMCNIKPCQSRGVSIHNTYLQIRYLSLIPLKPTPSCFNISKNYILWVVSHLTKSCFHFIMHPYIPMVSCTYQKVYQYAAENPIFKANRYFHHHPAEAITTLLLTQQKTDLDNAHGSSIER